MNETTIEKKRFSQNLIHLTLENNFLFSALYMQTLTFYHFVNFHLEQIWRTEKYRRKYEKMPNSSYVFQMAA